MTRLLHLNSSLRGRQSHFHQPIHDFRKETIMRVIPLQLGLLATVLLSANPSFANLDQQMTDSKISGVMIAQKEESDSSNPSRTIAQCGSHDAAIFVKKVPPGCRERGVNMSPEKNETSATKKRHDRIDRNGFRRSSI
ncbi:MAG: hypothetical protein KME35_04810 [Aphanocapsa sp. GSE-SYN-MK-11-07L]|jgi:hypothetical protein|nr:hypothetical protein [Aphanocapsa sp. GSE-SYN-MK-11-07L]